MSGKTLEQFWTDAAALYTLAGDDRVAQALTAARRQFLDACTSRPPKPEWLELWPAWWIGNYGTIRQSRLFLAPGEPGKREPSEIVGLDENGDEMILRWADIREMLPVLCEGYGPAGWQVVET